MIAAGTIAGLTILGGLAAADGGLPAPDAAGPPVPPHLRQVAKEWSGLRHPARGAPLAIGSYSGGCLQGAARLPAKGPGFETLHLQRNRHFGHPALVKYLRNLAAGARKAKLGVLVIGDLSQPRGGPMPSGHRSHQIGLDADVGYVPPPGLRPGRVSARDRERLAPPAVVDLTTRQVTGHWDPKILRLLQLAVDDPAVDRIFVHPAIKRMLCQGATAKSPWQPRVRPWWGHHDHFHVRLRCPPDSLHCQPQETPADDGCGATLDWWFSPDAEATRSRRKQAESVEAEPVLPEPCRPLLSP